ncbi:hypothetical protein BD311DRAFT_132640 [Dichomitus squalens]|uniref:Uncharacterized protein n=1 Tax=Dichomitus squalens TaxID=114155 RepID=A0A4Q9MY36_9APHY|nr:hypothetical protein BD311DRAFT_132640 [Dichomitus squalens]
MARPCELRSRASRWASSTHLPCETKVRLGVLGLLCDVSSYPKPMIGIRIRNVESNSSSSLFLSLSLVVIFSNCDIRWLLPPDQIGRNLSCQMRTSSILRTAEGSL